VGAVGFETTNTRTPKDLADSGGTQRNALDVCGTLTGQELDRKFLPNLLCSVIISALTARHLNPCWWTGVGQGKLSHNRRQSQPDPKESTLTAGAGPGVHLAYYPAPPGLAGGASMNSGVKLHEVSSEEQGR
jgi:hypothetical protein